MNHPRICTGSLALVLLLLLVLPACGGDDDASSGGGEPTPTRTAVQAGGGTADVPSEQPTGTSEPTQRSDGGAAEDVPHTCDLITAEEVSAAIGYDVGEGRDYLATAQNATQCEWDGPVVVYAEVLAEGGRSWFESVHFGASELEEVEVPDLGDKAMYSDFLNLVDAVSGDTYVAVQIIGAGLAGIDEREAATALVEAIFAKLE